uniref:Putative ixostatin n=1 Tax=Ixodes ricinus TaxID=34613 RepID=A0A0K8R656_IXORI
MMMSIFIITMFLGTFLHDAKSISGNWYIDKTLSHMPKECKQRLEREYKSACEKIQGTFKDFQVCKVQCMVTKGSHVKLQYVKLKDGLPCGRYGEVCKQGICYGPCDVEFFDRVR